MKKVISFCFIFFILTNFDYVTNLQLHETDYFAYYIKQKNIIICSDKEYLSSNLVLNEFQNENGFTCLIDLKKSGVHKINLKVSKIEDKEGIFNNEKTITEKDENKTALEISIGSNSVYRNLDLTSLGSRSSFKKEFFVILDERGIVSFLPSNDCDLNKIETCKSVEAKDSLFVKKFIKLNFSFKVPNYQETILLEKETTLNKKSKIIKII